MEYRTRFWERYASVVQHRDSPLDIAATDHWSRAFEHWFRGWIPVNRDAAIVDIACGAGNMLRFFSRLGFTNVMGVDISPSQIALARAIHPNVECCDVLDFLTRSEKRFDLILAIDLVEHLTKDEFLTFCDRVWTALRPGGRLVIQTPNGSCPLVGEYRYGDFTHEQCLTPKSLSQVMMISRFVDYEAREQGPVPLRLASTVRMVLWKITRLYWMLYNMIETGNTGTGIYTRNFIASARRPE